VGKLVEGFVGGGREETGRGKDRFKISELFADERWRNQAARPRNEKERTRGIPCTAGGGRGARRPRGGEDPYWRGKGFCNVLP